MEWKLRKWGPWDQAVRFRQRGKERDTELLGRSGALDSWERGRERKRGRLAGSGESGEGWRGAAEGAQSNLRVLRGTALRPRSSRPPSAPREADPETSVRVLHLDSQVAWSRSRGHAGVAVGSQRAAMKTDLT